MAAAFKSTSGEAVERGCCPVFSSPLASDADTFGSSSGATVVRRGGTRAIKGSGGGDGNGSARRLFGRRVSVLKQQAKELRAKGSAARKNLVLEHLRGVPVRELMQHLYTVERNRSIREGFVFLVYFILFLAICFNLYDTDTMYNTNAAVQRLMLETPFRDGQYKKNFHEVMTQGEFWQWLEEPFLDAVLPEELYSGRPLSEKERGTTLRYLQVVGRIQLRQARMSNSSCTERRFTSLISQYQGPNGEELGRYDTKGGWCYSEFELSSQDTTPFGPDGKYTWSDGYHNMNGLIGFGASYGTGGFVSELPVNRTEAQAQIAQMKQDRWTDLGTRAVAVSVNMYNTQTRLVTVVRILFEFYNSAHLTRSVKVFSNQLKVYQSKMDFVRLGFEILYILLCLHYVRIEAREWYYHRPRSGYFRSFRNLFELTVLGVNFIFMFEWALYLLSPERSEFDVNQEHFTDMYSMAEAYTLTFSWAAILALAYCLKIFEFLALSKKMSTLWLTLNRAMSDIVAFIVGFVIVVAGFAFMGMYMFGWLLVDFHNFASSFSTLLRLPLGDFSYDDLKTARPALASMFFNLYVASVFLVIMNMFIGIVTKYFDEVHEEARRVDRWKASSRTWERNIVQWFHMQLQTCILRFCKGRKSDSIEIQELNLEKKMLLAEIVFIRHLKKCVVAAKRQNNLSLYGYMYRLYELPDADHMYIGMHELCGVLRREPCRVGKHMRRKCEAWELLTLYQAIKTTTMIGDIRTHHPIESDVTRSALDVFTVKKVSIGGHALKRRVVVHPEKGLLLSFNLKMKLRKAIPIATLVQLDESLTDDTQLTLLFNAGETMDADKGMRNDDEEGESSGTAVETLYTLYFLSAMHKEQFVRQVLAVKKKGGDAVPVKMLHADTHGQGGGGGPAAAQEDSKANPGVRETAAAMSIQNALFAKKNRVKQLEGRVDALVRQVSDLTRRDTEGKRQS